MAPLTKATLRRLRMPLIRPYKLSYKTFEEFEPFVVELEDADGRRGFADGHISPGSSSETREGGWAFITARLGEIMGREPGEASAHVLKQFDESKVAATAIGAAIEVLEGSPYIAIPAAVAVPLLTPTSGHTAAEIEQEVEERLAEGFRTFKIKVGKDVDADLTRVGLFQKAVGKRATLRLDANRAFSRDDGMRFARSLKPEQIELFEQPCESAEWAANADVASVSTVPVMLDEPICTLADIDRAAGINGVGLCKLKLKRFGSMARLQEGLERVRAGGMEPVLGDGIGSEIQNWLEACVARTTIRNAGEFNGFLKSKDTLFVEPLKFEAGAIQIPAGFKPRLDPAKMDRLTIESAEFRAD